MADFDYRRTALLVITPDAVRRHLARQVVSRVRAAGFTVAAHRLWPAAPPGLDPFHRRNEPVARDPRLRRTVEELFDLGPLLALGVQEGPGRPADGVHRRLAELKGRGDPAWSAPGSIRKDLGSINTVLNIVHSSDDAEDTAREAALFLEAGPGLPETGPAALDAAVRAAERGRPREDRGHDEVLGGVRARVLTGIRPSLPPEQREHADRWCEQHGAGGLAGPGGGALLAGLLPPGHGIDGILAPPPPGTTPAGPVPEVETAALAALGVALDPWEHLVLGTSRHYPPPAARPHPTAVLPAAHSAAPSTIQEPTPCPT